MIQPTIAAIAATPWDIVLSCSSKGIRKDMLSFHQNEVVRYDLPTKDERKVVSEEYRN